MWYAGAKPFTPNEARMLRFHVVDIHEEVSVWDSAQYHTMKYKAVCMFEIMLEIVAHIASEEEIIPFEEPPSFPAACFHVGHAAF
jgi:hypothetical protein